MNRPFDPRLIDRRTALQRLGRANHRLDKPSRALLVPGNRFEVLECQAAIEAIRAHSLDGEDLRAGGLDVLAQHILGMACSAPFDAQELYEEIISAAPYADLRRSDFNAVLGFVATGGYASAPAGMFAVLTGVPLAVQEQNSFPGLTVRMLARFAALRPTVGTLAGDGVAEAGQRGAGDRPPQHRR